MTRVLLINPPSPYLENDAAYPPMGLLYVAASLEQLGCEVDILDYTVEPDHQRWLLQYCSSKVDLVGITCVTPNAGIVSDIVSRIDPKVPVMIGGAHATYCATEALQDNPSAFAVTGEAEMVLKEVIQDVNHRSLKRVYNGIAAPVEIIPKPARHLVNLHDYSPGGDKATPVYTSRGCPFTCLHGDTLIDTTVGVFKIRDLVGITPKVLTRNPTTKEVCYAQSSLVAKTGENKPLLRVKFREGSYIDCTPDHRFIVFKNGNQSVCTREVVTEAQQLKPGNSVRAIHREFAGYLKYEDIIWGRRLRRKKHILIMESMIGRQLQKNETVHHIDHNNRNNVESNLLLTTTHDHIGKYHPEVSQHMKDNNPVWSISPEKRSENSRLNSIGKTRTIKSRILYRESKLGEKNPNYKGGKYTGRPSRIKEINHIVESIEHLPELYDTFCLEVPGHDWFYANDVLVHNCKFCCKGGKYREFPIPRVIEEVKDCMALGFDKIVFGDDNVGINPVRLMDLLESLKPLDIQFRLNMDARNPRRYICEEAVQAGCTDISFGIESGSQDMLDAMNKQTTVLRNELAIYNVQDSGMEAKAYFMVNFPGETEVTVQETLDFAEKAHPDKWLLSAFAPLPGSHVFNNPKMYGITSMSRNWSDYYLVGKDGQFRPCFETKYLTHGKQIELHDMMWNGLKEILG